MRKSAPRRFGSFVATPVKDALNDSGIIEKTPAPTKATLGVSSIVKQTLKPPSDRMTPEISDSEPEELLVLESEDYFTEVDLDKDNRCAAWEAQKEAIRSQHSLGSQKNQTEYFLQLAQAALKYFNKRSEIESFLIQLFDEHVKQHPVVDLIFAEWMAQQFKNHILMGFNEVHVQGQSFSKEAVHVLDHFSAHWPHKDWSCFISPVQQADSHSIVQRNVDHIFSGKKSIQGPPYWKRLNPALQGAVVVAYSAVQQTSKAMTLPARVSVLLQRERDLGAADAKGSFFHQVVSGFSEQKAASQKWNDVLLSTKKNREQRAMQRCLRENPDVLSSFKNDGEKLQDILFSATGSSPRKTVALTLAMMRSSVFVEKTIDGKEVMSDGAVELVNGIQKSFSASFKSFWKGLKQKAALVISKVKSVIGGLKKSTPTDNNTPVQKSALDLLSQKGSGTLLASGYKTGESQIVLKDLSELVARGHYKEMNDFRNLSANTPQWQALVDFYTAPSSGVFVYYKNNPGCLTKCSYAAWHAALAKAARESNFVPLQPLTEAEIVNAFSMDFFPKQKASMPVGRGSFQNAELGQFLLGSLDPHCYVRLFYPEATTIRAQHKKIRELIVAQDSVFFKMHGHRFSELAQMYPDLQQILPPKKLPELLSVLPMPELVENISVAVKQDLPPGLVKKEPVWREIRFLGIGSSEKENDPVLGNSSGVRFFDEPIVKNHQPWANQRAGVLVNIR